MADVKWIKLNVGMFDGNSFKKIKKAKIGGESFRDKLTAVWFELLDFAGKCNAGGQLIESPEIPFLSIDDIAVLIDREPEELNLCMQYYIANRMVTVIDDIYMLTNWAKYQSTDKLAEIREQNRQRVAKHRENKRLQECNATSNVTVTLCNALDIDKDKEREKDLDLELNNNSTPTATKPTKHKYGEYGWILLTDAEYDRLVTEFGEDKVKEKITYIDETTQSNGNKNKYKDWNLVIRRAIKGNWGGNTYQKQQQASSSNPFLDMLKEG